MVQYSHAPNKALHSDAPDRRAGELSSLGASDARCSSSKDIRNRSIRLAEERRHHLETEHPEMTGQIPRIAETIANPDKIIRSRTE